MIDNVTLRLVYIIKFKLNLVYIASHAHKIVIYAILNNVQYVNRIFMCIMGLAKLNATLLSLLLNKCAKIVAVPKDVCFAILLILFAMYVIKEDGILMGLV